MNLLKELCESTGLGQWEMANLLRINRSAINMAERGERELPADAYLRLVQICGAMHTLEETVLLYFFKSG